MRWTEVSYIMSTAPELLYQTTCRSHWVTSMVGRGGLLKGRNQQLAIQCNLGYAFKACRQEAWNQKSQRVGMKIIIMVTGSNPYEKHILKSWQIYL